MKVKLLKKLRKRFHWSYDHDKKHWILADHKTQRLRTRKELYQIVEWMIGDYLGIWSSLNYIERALKRINKVQYKAHMDVESKTA